MDLTEDELKPLYNWIDQIPLSRPKRNIARDFSDGVLVAEVIAHFYPKLVELHNYSSANAMTQKVYNWQTLNTRALKKLGFQIPRDDFMDVANCRAGAVERVLKMCKFKMAEFQQKHGVAGKGTTTVATRSANGQVGQGGGGAMGSPQQIYQQQPRQQSPGAPMDVATDNSSPGVVLCEQCGHVNHVVGGVAIETNARLVGGGILKATSHGTADDENAETSDPIMKRKDSLITELRETNSILDAKSRKLEQLVRLKDAKVQTLLNKLQALGALRQE